jgi:glutamate--cysteine ligase
MATPALTKEECREFISQRLFEPRSTFYAASPGVPGFIGVELETFPYLRHPQDDRLAQPAPLFGDEGSVMDSLLKASKPRGGLPKYWYPAEQDTGCMAQVECIEFPDGDRFLFEPGGQVEISTALCPSIDSLQDHLADKRSVLEWASRQGNIRFAQIGVNPWWHEDAMGNQLQKPRYRALEQYLNNIGPYGRQMMRQTGSLHINLDIGASSEIRSRRIIAANLLVPFATALFANSAISEGKANDHRSYRSYIWQHLDAARTGILKVGGIAGLPAEAALIDRYLDFALKAPLVYIPELGEGALPPHVTFEYWMRHRVGGLSPGISDLAHHVTLLFPEVRLKGYLEVRSVDAPPPQWQMIPVMFYTGLLYSDAPLDKTLSLLMPLAAQIGRFHALATMGLEAEDIFRISKRLMRLAIDGFAGLPASFRAGHHMQHLVDFFERFTCQRRTFADAQLDALRSGRPVIA